MEILLGILVCFTVVFGTADFINKRESRKSWEREQYRASLLTPEQREEERVKALRIYCDRYFKDPYVWQKENPKYYDDMCQKYKPNETKK